MRGAPRERERARARTVEHGMPMPTIEGLAAMDVEPPPMTADPTRVVATIQASARAWAKTATAESPFWKRVDLEHLNAAGAKQMKCKVGDKLRIYVPPRASEAQRRQRKAKHLLWYRGNHTVTAVNDDGSYVITSPSGKKFERTTVNILPWIDRDSDAPDLVAQAVHQPPAGTAVADTVPAPLGAPTLGCPASTDVFKVGDFFIARDSPLHDRWWLNEVMDVTDDMLTARIYGTKSPDYKAAKFVPVWLFTRNNRVITPTPPTNPAKLFPCH